MKQEDRELLLKDLCARLPYGVKAQVRINVKYSDAHKPNSETCIGDIWGITTNKPYTAWVYSFITIYPCGPEQNICSISECKPYLRPMSSMTEEERIKFSKLLVKRYCEEDWEGHISTSYCIEIDNVYTDDGNGIKYPSVFSMDAIDWLNAHHFDYRGLIEEGLALEAHDGMYNIKKK